jgi:peptidoglycan/LPS O-acetylase OafA/YrhL
MQATFTRLIHKLLFNPDSDLQFFLAAGLAIVVFVMVLNKVGVAMDLKVAQTGRSLPLFVLLLAAELLVLAFLPRAVKLPGWGMIGVSVGVVLIVGVPLTCLLLKGSYFNALFSLLLSIAAVVVVLLFVDMGFGVWRKGEQGVGIGLDHNRETRTFLKE